MPKHHLTRRNFFASITSLTALSVAALASTIHPAFAKSISRISQSGNGLALKGYDTTAYFQSGQPMNGSNSLSVEWNGATWRFATESDAKLFKANPDAYAPQFGGYCTRAMSLGKEVPGDPEVWRIHQGKLYVFYARRGGSAFDKGEDTMIKKAQAHWDTLTLLG